MADFCPRFPQYLTGRMADRQLRKKDGRVKVVQYYSRHCGACQEAHPKIEALQREFCGDIDVIKISVDEKPNEPLADAAKVKYLPTVAVYRNGEQLARTTGDKDYEKFSKMVQRQLRKLAKESKK